MIEIALAGARWVQFAAAMLLCGVPTFVLYGLTPEAAKAENRWVGRTLVFAVVLGLVGAVVGLLLQSAEMTGDFSGAIDPGTLWAVLSETFFGSVWSIRLGLLLVLGVAILWLPDRPYRMPILALGGAIVAGSLAWLGHGGEGGAGLGEIHRVADVVHVLAAGVWIGALVFLGRLMKSEDHNALHSLRKFSGVGSIVVGAILLTGILNAWALIAPTPIEQAITSAYGVVLSLKVVLFVLMLALAGLNRFVLTPRLSNELGSDVKIAVVSLKRSIYVETLLAALVITAVAALGVMEPPSAG